jgi:hypothetical protein
MDVVNSATYSALELLFEKLSSCFRTNVPVAFKEGGWAILRLVRRL